MIALFGQPLLCFVGVLLNLLSLIAFIPAFKQSYYRKTSLLVYLIALNVCNTAQLTLSFFVIILPAAEQVSEDSKCVVRANKSSSCANKIQKMAENA